MKNLFLMLVAFSVVFISCNQNNTTVTPNTNNNNNNNNNNTTTPTTFFKAKIDGVWFEAMANNMFFARTWNGTDSIAMISGSGPYNTITYNLQIHLGAAYIGPATYSGSGIGMIFEKIPMEFPYIYATDTDDSVSTSVGITSDNNGYVSGVFSGKVFGGPGSGDTLNITDGSFTARKL